MKRLISIFLIASIVLFSLYSCGLLVKEANRAEEHSFVINGEKYIGISVVFTRSGRKIAKADSFSIYEIPEDKERNFLSVSGFLDNWVIVKESYVIPTEGEITVAYFGYHERVTKGIKWDMLQSILNEDFEGEFIIKGEEINEYLSDVWNATEYITVGYEDCPVGTDVIGKFGKINGEVVFIKAHDFGVDEYDLEFTCYILKDKYQEFFNDLIDHDFEVINKS